ncbi:MAG TPA: hypothetical protein IAA30_08940 [Candidatus Treponema faecavium]|nr:hypothetical protein [Candidatus Treponema faecavium]
MKSEWRVLTNPVGTGKFVYQVYRLIDTQKVMHGGNMEFSGGVFETKAAAEELAALLNKEEI